MKKVITQVKQGEKEEDNFFSCTSASVSIKKTGIHMSVFFVSLFFFLPDKHQRQTLWFDSFHNIVFSSSFFFFIFEYTKMMRSVFFFFFLSPLLIFVHFILCVCVCVCFFFFYNSFHVFLYLLFCVCVCVCVCVFSSSL